MKKIICIFFSIVFLVMSITACGKKQNNDDSADLDDISNGLIENDETNLSPNPDNNNLECEIKIEIEGEGAVKGGGVYQFNDEVSLVALEEAGYRFVCWKDENGKLLSASKQLKIVVKGNAYYNAVFEKLKVSIRLNKRGRGVVEGAGEYWFGDYVNLNAIPGEHSTFVRWENEFGKPYSESQRLILIAQEDLCLTAVYEDTYKICKEYLFYEKYTSKYIELEKKVVYSPIFLVNMATTTTTIYKSAEVQNGIIFEFGNWQSTDADFVLQISELNETAVTQNWSRAVNLGAEGGSVNIGIKFGYSVQKFISNTKGIITTYTYPLTDYDPNYFYRVVLIGDYEIITKEVQTENHDGLNPGMITFTYEKTLNIPNYSKCQLALVCKGK